MVRETLGSLPESLNHLKDKGLAIFNDCRTTHGPLLDDSDEFCKPYGALVKCIMGLSNLVRNLNLTRMS